MMITSRAILIFSLRDVLNGAIAGLIATVPMTISMFVGWRLLPEREKYPLPPRQILGEITERLGKKGQLTEGELEAATLFSHFGYGALSGSTYALLEQRIPLKSGLKGGLAGLILWAGSYLGWLPVVGILTPATRHPWRRNLLMIVAHLIWGVALGETIRRFR